MNTKSIKLATMSLSAILVLGVTSVANAQAVNVKSGDTLSELADTYNVSVEDLANDNGISNLDFIKVGDVLQVNAKKVNKAHSKKDIAKTTDKKLVVETPVTTETPVVPQQETQQVTPTPASQGSVYDQFISAGGTDAMWNSIVMPESTGNPNASNGQYHGLFQTNQSWGYGDVATQTQGAINYAVTRYGSISGAISFRASNNWW